METNTVLCPWLHSVYNDQDFQYGNVWLPGVSSIGARFQIFSNRWGSTLLLSIDVARAIAYPFLGFLI
jgi:hypothetical protein